MWIDGRVWRTVDAKVRLRVADLEGAWRGNKQVFVDGRKYLIPAIQTPGAVIPA